MMPHYRIRKNSNRIATAFIVFVALALPLSANAQFKSDRDRKIVGDILKTFGRQCIQRVATDSEILKRLDVEAKDANRIGNPATKKCYENYYSQVTGVSFLYQKICRDVSANVENLPDDTAAKQLLEVNHYQLGLRPFHSSLNDCLIAVADRRGESFLVPLAGADLDVKALEREIDKIKIGDPFATTFPVPAR
jgi:hypothetical protein